MAMTFVFILAGCGASPSSIVIRNLADPNTDLEAMMEFQEKLIQCGADVACAFTLYETLPPITGPTAPVLDTGGFIIGSFYATFDTGRAAEGAITWTMTIGGTAVPSESLIQGSGIVAFLGLDIPPTGDIVLTASTNVSGVPDRRITLNPVEPDFDFDMREWIPRLPMGNLQRPSNSRRY